MDPFSEDITGSHFFDAGVVNRLTMGYWNPKNTEDTILGLLSEGRRSRPVLVDPFTLEENRQYSATLSVPKSVPTAEPYTINLKLENHSGNILLLDKILWDAEDVSGHLEVNHVLTLAAPPHGSLTIPLYNIVFPALLYDGEAVHKVAISPENSLFTPAIVSYSILYTPNVKLLLVGIAVVASLLLGGIIYSWRRKLI
jgi:hypothetical protein